jgi:hypothetical protein
MFEDFYMPEFDADYLSPGISSYGMAAGQPAYNDVTLYGEKVGSPYGMMADQYNAPVGTMGIGGGDFVMAGPSASRIPTSAVTSPYARPSATPSLDFVTDRGGQQGYYFVTNAGRAAKTKANPTGFVSVDPNAEYRLVNERGQNVVVASGTGEQGLRDAYAAAQRLSTEGGKKADWYLERSSPDGKWTRIADDDPKGSDLGVVGDIAGFALPIAAAILTAGASLPAQMAAAGLAGGVGGALAGDNPLKAALLNAATAGVMNASGANKAISGALNSVLGPAATKATEEVVSKAGEEAFEQILVKGASKAVQAAANAAGNTLLSEGVRAGLGGTSAPQPPPVQPPVEEPPVAIVTGARPEAVTGANLVSGIGGGAAADAVAGDTGTDTLEEEEAPIVVTAPEAAPPAVPDVTAGIGGAIPGLIPGAAVYDPTENVIVNTATPEPIAPEPPAIPLVSVALPGLQTTPVQQPDLLSEVNPEVPEERSILDTALDVADIATTVVPVVGGVVAGGVGRGGTIPPDTSGITFRRSPLRQTLTGGIGGGSGGIGGTGALYPYTPTTYGRAGGDQETEFLFFTRDPVTGAAAAPAVVPASAPGKKEGGEIEDDMVKHLVEYHKNGGHHGPGQVKGIGSGQDDKIPAWLSDGEYVWSAQDVADLGDGSTDEGVRRLDKMRQMVRQQAGRKDVKKIAKPQKGIDKMLKAVGGLA